MMHTWQYKVIVEKTKGLLKDGGTEDLEHRLAQLGAEGWELVSASPFEATQGIDLGGSTKAFVLYLKRPQ